MPIIENTENGLYCPQGDFYIDPWKNVHKALITHAHSDHAMAGHTKYICMEDSIPILKYRLGNFIEVSGLPYGESIKINGVKVSFHPAGHIIGSAQIRLEYKGEIWVISGDYKTEDDGFCTPIQAVKCHTFISECTFGLPAFKWQPQQVVYDEINAWWQKNKEEGKTSIISAYALGKAQRLINNLDKSIGPIYAHGAIQNTHEVLRKMGLNIATSEKPNNRKNADFFRGSMVLASPTAIGTAWTQKFAEPSEAVVSGWMLMRGARRRRGVEKGFVLSDHADWEGLNMIIKETGASKILVTHGYTSIFAKWLKEQGYDAGELKTFFQDEPEMDDAVENDKLD